MAVVTTWLSAEAGSERQSDRPGILISGLWGVVATLFVFGATWTALSVAAPKVDFPAYLQSIFLSPVNASVAAIAIIFLSAAVIAHFYQHLLIDNARSFRSLRGLANGIALLEDASIGRRAAMVLPAVAWLLASTYFFQGILPEQPKDPGAEAEPAASGAANITIILAEPEPKDDHATQLEVDANGGVVGQELIR